MRRSKPRRAVARTAVGWRVSGPPGERWRTSVDRAARRDDARARSASARAAGLSPGRDVGARIRTAVLACRCGRGVASPISLPCRTDGVRFIAPDGPPRTVFAATRRSAPDRCRGTARGAAIISTVLDRHPGPKRSSCGRLPSSWPGRPGQLITGGRRSSCSTSADVSATATPVKVADPFGACPAELRGTKVSEARASMKALNLDEAGGGRDARCGSQLAYVLGDQYKPSDILVLYATCWSTRSAQRRRGRRSRSREALRQGVLPLACGRGKSWSPSAVQQMLISAPDWPQPFIVLPTRCSRVGASTCRRISTPACGARHLLNYMAFDEYRYFVRVDLASWCSACTASTWLSRSARICKGGGRPVAGGRSGLAGLSRWCRYAFAVRAEEATTCARDPLRPAGGCRRALHDRVRQQGRRPVGRAGLQRRRIHRGRRRRHPAGARAAVHRADAPRRGPRPVARLAVNTGRVLARRRRRHLDHRRAAEPARGAWSTFSKA